jgi:copper chaperone NosL
MLTMFAFGNWSQARVWRACWLWSALLLLLLAACNSGTDLDAPPEIRYGEDTCDRCQMIINEARYAAAYVTEDGLTRRFDDIGGMVAFHQEMAEDVAVFWVHDYLSESWLKAEAAFLVNESAVQTPMGFGVIAFSTSGQAEEWAAGHGGVVMTFTQLLEGGSG